MDPRRRLAAGALWLAAAFSGCAEGTGTGEIGQLRIHPVFAAGEEPGALGVSVEAIHLVLRRDGAAGPVLVDTTLAYVSGATTSWLLDLQNPPETVAIAGELGQGTTTMYAGTGQASVASGIGPSSTTQDLPMRYLSQPPAFTVDVTPDSTDAPSAGLTRQFNAVARDAAGSVLSGFAFSWSSANTAVATVSASGLATAVGPGRTTIRATAGGVTDTAVFRVGPVSMDVQPGGSWLAVGGTQQFTAIAFDAAGQAVHGIAFTWESSKPLLASVSSAGLVTGVAAGVAVIRARAGSLVDTAIVRVGVTSIVVTPDTASITVGTTQQFTAVALDGLGQVVPGVTFTWSTSPPGVAVVDAATGLATGASVGVTDVIASAEGVSGAATLNVVPSGGGHPVTVVVTPGIATLTALGSTQQFTAVARDAQGRVIQGAIFNWSSSVPSIASVDPSGLARAASRGATIITATTYRPATGDSISGSALLTVSQVVASITVAPPAATIIVGDYTGFTAVARDANGFVISGATFAWTTGDPTIATVDGTGVATGVTAGSVPVTASAGGKSGSAALKVINVGSISVTPDGEVRTVPGGTVQFSAVVFDVAGSIIPGARVTWTSLDPSIATIDPATGLATALRVGVVAIRATAGGVSSGAWLLVR